MKNILPLCIFILFSCNSRDPKMCDCLDAGDKLNKFSSKLLTKEASQKDVAEMKKLKAEKAKKCADFQMMSGEEMLKKKATCTE
ncbi:MAG: hypothetical protein ACK5B9_12990 [Flavobacteriia bacterium]|jgi:hypothetical protein